MLTYTRQDPIHPQNWKLSKKYALYASDSIA